MNFIKPIIEPFFHQGLGMKIHGRKQLREELRARNLHEIDSHDHKAANVVNPNIGREGHKSNSMMINLNKAEELIRRHYGD